MRYNWFIDQTEYVMDIVFNEEGSLEPLYEHHKNGDTSD
jgi:hypothetical protein